MNNMVAINGRLDPAQICSKFKRSTFIEKAVGITKRGLLYIQFLAQMRQKKTGFELDRRYPDHR